jgi:hypothetical protein
MIVDWGVMFVTEFYTKPIVESLIRANFKLTKEIKLYSAVGIYSGYLHDYQSEELKRRAHRVTKFTSRIGLFYTKGIFSANIFYRSAGHELWGVGSIKVFKYFRLGGWLNFANPIVKINNQQFSISAILTGIYASVQYKKLTAEIYLGSSHKKIRKLRYIFDIYQPVAFSISFNF